MAFLASHWIAAIVSLISVTGLGALSFFFPTQALGVLSWIMRQRLSTLGCIVLAVLIVVQHAALVMAHRHSAKLETQLAKCGEQTKALTDQLHEISTKRDAQRIITQTRIVTVTKRIHDADAQAQKVEQAPPAPNCRTNQTILRADL